jgi:hypothetical protein
METPTGLPGWDRPKSQVHALYTTFCNQFRSEERGSSDEHRRRTRCGKRPGSLSSYSKLFVAVDSIIRPVRLPNDSATCPSSRFPRYVSHPISFRWALTQFELVGSAPECAGR